MVHFALKTAALLALVAPTLASSGDGETEMEWVGVFAVDDTTHTWLMQAKDGKYADPMMKIVLLATKTVSAEGMEALEKPGKALLAGTCADTKADAVLTPGSCYNLHVTAGATDTTFTINTTGISGLVILAEHVPTEFERDVHYLFDSKTTCKEDCCEYAKAMHNCIEPVAQEGADAHAHGGDHGGDHKAPEEPCSCMAQKDGFKIDCDDLPSVQAAFDALEKDGCDASEKACDASAACQKNYRILQSHHDHCPHDTLTKEMEQHYHDFEGACNEHGCVIARKFVVGKAVCPKVDCAKQADMTTASAGLVGCEKDCSSDKCKESFGLVHSFHDDCTHEQLDNTPGAAIEHDIHEFEEVCSGVAACNVVPEAFDPNNCADTANGVTAGAASLAATLSVVLAAALNMV